MGKIVAVDVGTTHIKSILFDVNGSVLEIEKCRTPLVPDGEGNAYDPEGIWQIVKRQIDKLIAFLPTAPIGISVTGMAEAGLIVSRKSQKPLTSILPWFDNRTKILSEGMSQEEEEINFGRTGLRNSYKYGVYKFLWLLEQKEIQREDAVWLSMCDYIVFRLTGEFVTDPTFAARTYLYDIIEHRWDESRMEEYGLSLRQFPKVLDSGKAAGEYGGIPVAVAGHDHILAAFALLYGNREKVCDSAGTSETYIGLLEEPSMFHDSGLQYGPFVTGGYFYLANVPSSGHSVEWFRKSLQMDEISYEKMNRELETLDGEPTGILYYPYLTGMGAPWYRPECRGAILGISASHNGADILKGMLEGIQYQAKWILGLAEKSHRKKITELVCAGGGVNNTAMMQIKANILGVDVGVSKMPEATLLGAAALFLYQNRGKEYTQEFLQKNDGIDRVYHTEPKISRKYELIFENEFIRFLK